MAHRSYVWLVLLLALAGNAATAQHYTVTVEAPEAGYSQTPVAVPVSGAGRAEGAILLRADTGDIVPCQLASVDGELVVAWIIDSLPKGETRTYDLALTDEPSQARSGVELTEEADGLAISIDGEFFTRYVTTNSPKPYFYPIIGPTGQPVTRSYPMADVEGESQDHPHHRSLWFTHDQVNGQNFWHEAEVQARTLNRAYETIESGPVYGRFVGLTDWVTPEGEKVCEDRRDVRIYNVESGRLFDFDITWTASEGPLHLGDTKEGVFGFRVAESMTLSGGAGHIVNAAGDRDGDTWGKAAEWCDYYGPIAGETVGMAILDAPQNPGHPTHWHVRDYGLFCANIFGLSYFEPGSGKDGSIDLAQGESLRFHYRVLIHRGTTEEADIAGAYASFETPPTIVVSESEEK